MFDSAHWSNEADTHTMKDEDGVDVRGDIAQTPPPPKPPTPACLP